MKRKRLRQRLASGPVVVAPGIYDAYGARPVIELAEAVGKIEDRCPDKSGRYR